MRLAQAEKHCPGAHFVPAYEERYRAAHETLLVAAGRFTPTVENAGLGLVYAEVAGLRQRFGSESRLAQQMAWEAITRSRLDVRVGIAGGKFSAEQAARAARPGESCAVSPGEERAFLSPLPLAVLPADPEMQRRLHLLGVRTLGALAALPHLAVVRQFGPHAGPLHDLARGIDPRPVHADAPPLALERTRPFDDPLEDRAVLLAHAAQMAAELAETLARRGCQAEGLRVKIEEEDDKMHAADAPVKPPSADTDKLSRLAGRLLGSLAPAEAVAALTLTVYPLRPFHLGAAQLALFSDALDVFRGTIGFGLSQGKHYESLWEVLRRLRERFGEFIIVIASLLGPPLPQPIQVTCDPHGLPRALVWRDRIREVAAIYESWRERRRWWSIPIERDYFRLETDDGQVRVVFREPRSGRWLLERRHI
jgi:nucleotidyltransferase/DNA polymerase involved in DNA repair